MIALIFTVLSVIVACICLWTTQRMKEEHLEHLNAVAQSAYKRGYEAGIKYMEDITDVESYRKGYMNGVRNMPSQESNRK